MRGLGRSGATSGTGTRRAGERAGCLGRLGRPEWPDRETARRRAPNVTQIVFWRTGAPKVMENVLYFEY